VLKDGKQRRSTIREVVDGQERVRSFPYVYTRKFNKEMLGQYAVALDVAQELGITELDSIRIYVADPRVNLRKSKVLVFFYDSDDEVIERTLIGEKQWVRCADPGQS
jgi:hypothetical protein